MSAPAAQEEYPTKFGIAMIVEDDFQMTETDPTKPEFGVQFGVQWQSVISSMRLTAQANGLDALYDLEWAFSVDPEPLTKNDINNNYRRAVCVAAYSSGKVPVAGTQPGSD